MTSLWLASSMTTTSNRVKRGSKFSTTRESGMTQTGTALRHSDIFRAASARSTETRTPWPLPILRMVSSQPTSACRLRGPGPAVDQVDRHAAKMLAELFDFRLQRFEGNLGAAIEFVIELAPNPGGGRIARRLAAAMHTGAIANRRGPRRRRALQFAEEPAAKIEVRLAALQFKKKIISFAIGAAILFVNGFLQLDEDLGCAGAARGGLVAALQIAKFSFELEHPQFFVARV